MRGKVKKKYILPRLTEKERDEQYKCIACNGSGHYDHNGWPPCSACNGTGKVNVYDR